MINKSVDKSTPRERGQSSRARAARRGGTPCRTSRDRDDREFDRPDVFDVERKPGRTVSFGAGIHLCMGLHVARLESRVMLEGILEHGPRYEIELDGVERCRLAGIHGYDSVPIVLAP